jgi:hypothetical protein
VAVIIPIPQPAWRDAVPGFLSDEVGEAAHHVEIVLEDLPVAEPHIVLPRHQYRRRTPLHRPIKRALAGIDVGKYHRPFCRAPGFIRADAAGAAAH